MDRLSLHTCPLSSPLLYWLWLCSCPWLFVEKMKRSSWQRRKSLSSSKSSILFCSQEFFSREICSWVRRLVITMYELLTEDGPAEGVVSERAKRDRLGNHNTSYHVMFLKNLRKSENQIAFFGTHHQNSGHSGWKILAAQSCSLHRGLQFHKCPHFLELNVTKQVVH